MHQKTFFTPAFTFSLPLEKYFLVANYYFKVENEDSIMVLCFNVCLFVDFEVAFAHLDYVY